MSESTIDTTRRILDLVAGKGAPMTGEEASYHATQLSGYLYRLQVIENHAKRTCDMRLIEILRDKSFWSSLGVKPSKTTAETQLQTEDTWQTYLDVQALRIGAQETIRSLRNMVKMYEQERKEF